MFVSFVMSKAYKNFIDFFVIYLFVMDLCKGYKGYKILCHLFSWFNLV